MKHNCNDTEPLLSGYLDRELTQSDRQRVELILEDCEECERAFKEIKQLRQGVSSISYEQLSEMEKITMRKKAESSNWATVGQLMFIIPLVLLYGMGSFYIVAGVFKEPDTPLWLKIGVPCIIGGLAIMVFTVLFQRLKVAKTDKYKDVQI